MDVLDWLLEGDPAIRWQVLRDLTDARTTRSRPSAPGSRPRAGARGCSRCATPTDSGTAAPASHGGSPRTGGPASSRTSPTASRGPPPCPRLVVLRDLGLDPASAAARETTALVAANCRWEHDGQAFFDGEVEACINGRTLSIGAYFGADVDGLVTRPARRAARRRRLELRDRAGLDGLVVRLHHLRPGGAAEYERRGRDRARHGGASTRRGLPAPAAAVPAASAPAR